MITQFQPQVFSPVLGSDEMEIPPCPDRNPPQQPVENEGTFQTKAVFTFEPYKNQPKNCCGPCFADEPDNYLRHPGLPPHYLRYPPTHPQNTGVSFSRVEILLVGLHS